LDGRPRPPNTSVRNFFLYNVYAARPPGGRDSYTGRLGLPIRLAGALEARRRNPDLIGKITSPLYFRTKNWAVTSAYFLFKPLGVPAWIHGEKTRPPYLKTT